MTREQRILLGLLLAGVALVCLAFGETFFDEFVAYRNRESARWAFGVIGAVLLVAGFVLREVFQNRQK